MRFVIFCLSLVFLSSCQQSKPNISITANQLTKVAENNAAHWLTPNQLVIAPQYQASGLYLIAVNSTSLSYFPLSADQQTSQNTPKHLNTFARYKLNVTDEQAKQLIQSPLFVAGFDQKQQLIWATGVQTALLLDALFTNGENDTDEITQFGATINNNNTLFKLWAPTAKQVSVLLTADIHNNSNSKTQKIPLTFDVKNGVWQKLIKQNLSGYFYQYQLQLYHPSAKKIVTINTTDPYSLSLSRNSKYSQIVDLSASNSQPKNWQTQAIPEIDAPEDNVIYEVHIRDFSAAEQHLTQESHRGKYGAFSEQHSDGIKQLKKLQQAGVTTIHLLPAFDIGTINETPEKSLDINDKVSKLCQLKPQASVCQTPENLTLTIAELLTQYEPTSNQAQALVAQIRDIDNYNWGYDPYHYNVPEGSYAENPDGIARIIEFRQMVQNLHQLGFRVVMDVVYNHTHQAGLAPKSVLDKIVPNYYHRLNSITGEIERSTCCDNTATEHKMMAKLMIDSLVVWAKHYKIDGFRFDLMGHQPKDVMLAARAAVRKVDPDSYFYGEGWNFGEVANNSQFIQASQLNLAGTEIGTYSDRLRDAVRGNFMNLAGSALRAAQGVGNGAIDNHNEQNAKLNWPLMLNQIRIGLTGNLANFPLKISAERSLTGQQIPYGNQPTGYALDPADTINYVSKHDNHTLWDNNQLRLPFSATKQQRIRYQVLSLSYTILAQGIPFMQMGAELLRSKSFLRDSYDYGDWFNKVDYAMLSNNYNVGLPPKEKNGDDWSVIQQILTKNHGQDIVNQADINFANQQVLALLAVRHSSKLFRMTNAKDIIHKLHFLNLNNQAKGVIAMLLDDTIAPQLDPVYKKILVLFNASQKPQALANPEALNWQLHPAQFKTKAEYLSDVKVTKNQVVIPAISTVVLVIKD